MTWNLGQFRSSSYQGCRRFKCRRGATETEMCWRAEAAPVLDVGWSPARPHMCWDEKLHRAWLMNVQLVPVATRRWMVAQQMDMVHQAVLSCSNMTPWCLAGTLSGSSPVNFAVFDLQCCSLWKGEGWDVHWVPISSEFRDKALAALGSLVPPCTGLKCQKGFFKCPAVSVRCTYLWARVPGNAMTSPCSFALFYFLRWCCCHRLLSSSIVTPQKIRTHQLPAPSNAFHLVAQPLWNSVCNFACTNLCCVCPCT